MRVFYLIYKEFLAVLKDPRSRISIIVPPILQLLIFSYAATLDVTHATIGVLNKDYGEHSIKLLERFYTSSVFKEVIYLDHQSEIAPFMDEQKGIVVLQFDEEFSKNIDAKKQARVSVIADGRRSNTAQILSGYIADIVEQYDLDLKLLLQNKKPPAKLMPRTWFNPNVIYLWYNIPCFVGTLSTLICLVVTAQSVAREREMGTLDQLLVSPLSVFQILVGKTVPGIIIGTVEATLMSFTAIFFLDVPFVGSFFAFILSLLVFTTAISGMGLFISSLCATQQQAMLGTFVFILPSILLSGFATPIENMPTWLQPVTYLLPLRYMMILSKGLFLKGISWQIVFSQTWPMALIACFSLTVASLFFRRRFS